MENAFHEILVTPNNIPAIILLHNSPESECLLHWHSSIEICYSANSKLLVTDNDNTFMLEEDSIAIINSGCSHKIKALPNHSKSSLSVIICYQFLKTIYPEIDNIIFKIDSNNEVYNELRLSLKKIYNLYKENNNKYRYLLANEALYRILYLLFNNFTENKLNSVYISSQKYHQRYEEILKYIEANYTEPLTLDDIASFSNISKHHLSREFKKYVGDGLKKHISKIRIKYSLNDLTTTDIPLIDIAINHGFNDARSYINAFKDIFGITPSKYRKDFMINKKVNDNVL